ncbi:peptidase C39 family protein [bacterium]|nr:peptidase C39 family protein [bacterium]
MLTTNTTIHIRLAVSTDLPALVQLEKKAFTADRFSEEHIDYLLTRARTSIFIAETDRHLAGVAYIQWRKNYQKARLYSIAIEPHLQNQGIGKALLKTCEMEAARRGCREMTLEVRPDNETANRFYESYGYLAGPLVSGFYEDGSPALRRNKLLSTEVPAQVRCKIPYYAQTIGFTCGPACLMMVMKYFDPEGKYNRFLEMNLWKEATLVFMTSGIGGTDPFGLALAAVRRHYSVRMITSTEKTPFVYSVRLPEKRAVIRLVHQGMKKEALALGVSTSAYDFTFEDIKSALLRGAIPISLISTYRLSGCRVPHWVVITGFDQKYVYIHDPYEGASRNSKLKARNMKIEHGEFQAMSRYGKDVYRCVIFIGPRESPSQ